MGAYRNSLCMPRLEKIISEILSAPILKFNIFSLPNVINNDKDLQILFYEIAEESLQY